MFAVAFLLPLTALGRRSFAFTPLPPAVTLLVAGVLGAYLLAAELFKQPLMRRLDAGPGALNVG